MEILEVQRRRFYECSGSEAVDLLCARRCQDEFLYYLSGRSIINSRKIHVYTYRVFVN